MGSFRTGRTSRRCSTRFALPGSGTIGAGIPEIEANRYAGRIREGGYLISVHCDDRDWVSRAKEILEATGGHDVVSTSEPRRTIGRRKGGQPHLPATHRRTRRTRRTITQGFCEFRAFCGADYLASELTSSLNDL
jgi:hypothetical protein